MSFNYLEVAQVADLLSKELPARVQSVELVEFPLPGPLPDLNMALRLSTKKLLVFSLRSPWTGLFYASPRLWAASRQTWAKAFDGAVDWNSALRGVFLEAISVAEGERSVELRLSGEATAVVELFPARPNWRLRFGGVDSSWRKPLSPKTHPPRGGPGLTVRDFVGSSGKDWMERACSHYLCARQDWLLAMQLQRARSQLQARVGQLTKVRAQMNESLAESEKADACFQSGEKLKALLHEYPKGFKAERLDGISLDPKLTLAENASKYFDRYKKLQRTKRELEARAVGVEEAVKKIAAAAATLRGFIRTPEEAFEASYRRLMAQMKEAELVTPDKKSGSGSSKKADKKWQDSGVRKFQSSGGLNVWIGRNHKENEELVVRLARGNDLWMHLKGRPGAHGVIPLPVGKSPPLDVLLDGATLVAYYSGVGKAEKVEVDYTFRKYVKRVPGQKDKFLVTYTQNKTLIVKLEEERLSRLLKQQ